MRLPEKIDLHMHTIASDGTDSPAQLLEKIKAQGIGAFAVTDHDAVKTCVELQDLLREGDPLFINGVELSCRDEFGKYHILGLGYDLNKKPLPDLVRHTHEMRMEKVRTRLAFLQAEYGFEFPQEEQDRLLALPNPGKPHIGNLMAAHGYAESKEQAITEYINKAKIKGPGYIRPEEAITAILGSGGVPVLAHPAYGDGSQVIVGEELEERVRRLVGFGLQGMECYYSGFTPRLQEMCLALADRLDLLVSAGSDYHGGNKMIQLGENNLEKVSQAVPALRRLLEICLEKRTEAGTAG